MKKITLRQICLIDLSLIEINYYNDFSSLLSTVLDNILIHELKNSTVRQLHQFLNDGHLPNWDKSFCELHSTLTRSFGPDSDFWELQSLLELHARGHICTNKTIQKLCNLYTEHYIKQFGSLDN